MKHLREALMPPGTVRIEFMDQSCVEFWYAIFIVSESKRAIAVFTEHCSHHLYPYLDAKIYRDGKLVYGKAQPRYPGVMSRSKS